MNSSWVALWGNAISITHRRPENYAKDLTLRYPITPLLSGDQIRITLDNFCGTEPVTIHHITIALSDSLGNLTGSPATITFMGKEQVTLLAGSDSVSDPIPFAVTKGDTFSISLYLGDYTQMRSGVIITGPLSGGSFSIGDQAMAPTLPLKETNKTDCYYFLSTIDILPTHSARSVICYGDSITAQSWPDYMMQELLQKHESDTTVIRRAASGTRILRQYDNIVYDSYGLKGTVRFPHESHVCGADTIIIHQGINDIIHPVGTKVNRFRPWSDLPSVEDLIAGLTYYIEESKKLGLHVYLGTLLPILGWRTYAPFRDELRNQLNDWMRTTSLVDGCIDFDLAVRDSKNPAAFAAGFDSGDHLHPSEQAYQVMALEALRVLSSD